MTSRRHEDTLGFMTKYFAHKIKTPFGVFDSKSEYERYLILLQKQKEGKIRELERQHTFEILPKLMRAETIQLKTKTKTVQRVEESAVHYTPDFTYYEGDVWVIEEVKSDGTMMARDYPLRRKLMKHLIAKHNETSEDKWLFREIVTKKPKKKKGR